MACTTHRTLSITAASQRVVEIHAERETGLPMPVQLELCLSVPLKATRLFLKTSDQFGASRRAVEAVDLGEPVFGVDDHGYLFSNLRCGAAQASLNLGRNCVGQLLRSPTPNTI